MFENVNSFTRLAFSIFGERIRQNKMTTRRFSEISGKHGCQFPMICIWRLLKDTH